MQKMLLLSVLMLIFPGTSVLLGQVSFINGGFEEFEELPTSVGQWYLCDSWNNIGSPTSNPDYYHLDGSFGGDLPQTPVAYVNAWEGKAVMGFAATSTPGNNRRSYLSSTLSENLQAGVTYRVSFYITNGEISTGSFGGLGTSHLGIYFSTEQPVQNLLEPLFFEPQFEKQTVLFSREWERIAFTFTANEDYSYMTFGVFTDDSEITIEDFEGSNPSLAYYFLDHFEIEQVPSGINEEGVIGKSDPKVPEPEDEPLTVEYTEDDFYIPNAFTPNGDGDNDFFRPVLTDHNEYTFCIYSRWGELIFMTQDPGSGWDGRTANGQSAGVGMYVWEISYYRSGDSDSNGKVLRKGSVHLIR